MNVLLIDIDSKIPNLALKKLERYYLDKGAQVLWDMPLFAKWADVIYVSCIFSWNRDKCKEWEMYPHSWIGGTGYDLDITLHEDIERVKPHINLGFTTRGCIRKCDFCIVPKKEGGIRIVGHLLDLWDDHSDLITVLDNNILALPEHFKFICRQAQEYKLRVDFNQGLDHRLLTDNVVATMKRTRHKGEYRFAFDHPDMIDSVKYALRLLQNHGIKRTFWYVLVGYNTTLDEDLFRLNYLRVRKQTVFVQRYNKCKDRLRLSQWANQHNVFRAMTYWQFLKKREGMNHGIRG